MTATSGGTLHHHHHGLFSISHHTVVAVVVSLLSSISFAVATVAQQRAAASVDEDATEGTSFVTTLLTSWAWWGGTLGNIGGYVLQAIALAYGSLLVVQPIIVTAVLFALPLDARLKKVKMPAEVWVWGVVLVVSLALFVVTGNPNRGLTHASPQAWVILAATLGPAMVLLTIAAFRKQGALRSGLLAVVVGVLAGVTALLTKVVVERWEGGVTHIFGSGELYALVVVGLTGVYLQQVAFQSGSLRASMPTIHVVEPLAAAVLGILLLQERLRVNQLQALVLVVVTVLMVLATIVLARDQADVELGLTPPKQKRQG